MSRRDHLKIGSANHNPREIMKQRLVDAGVVSISTTMKIYLSILQSRKFFSVKSSD
jgi:hypothetical protein